MYVLGANTGKKGRLSSQDGRGHALGWIQAKGASGNDTGVVERQ